MGIKEEVYFEGGPHIGDLILNSFLALTIFFIPLTIGALVRAIWLRFRITNRRVTVNGGWFGRSRTDLVYSEISEVSVIPRGLGFWGDMLIILKDGSRIELKSLPKFREIAAYIEEKVEAKSQAKATVASGSAS
ncbi:PH domain-containing protein [Acaryochloris sp. IP29b_bin.148]|uniref:PH domain-containing protein n=1 Tax=Acaryochloris sp. IP29b_bin.148 TaxID=2969218 RepID=UPI00260D8305|nr:PH domain-containing protein [Acaryochloris sp. IP29b_bin.148]